jgi:uncharacterized membrane-anchored protein YitT (DUF2179 family)
MKFSIKTIDAFKDVLLVVAGVAFAAFALGGFLVPNNFQDGGVSGVSLLLYQLYNINLSLVIILVNIPFLIMGGFQVGWNFAIRTLACILLLSLCVQFVHFPVITNDKLLVAIFGGFFMGLGVGLVMRAGCSLDGLEVLALYTLKRSSFTISEIILAFNAVIFLASAFYFNVERALFAMLTYYVASKTIDYVVEGLEEYTGVTIISQKSEEIKHTLVMKLGKGITVYKGERGFMKDSFEVSADCDIVFTVITRLEVRRLRTAIHAIDPKAFVVTNSIKETAGGVLKRRKEHH